MALTIFLMLNGLGVAFLLYVLANFLKEGHRPMRGDRIEAMEYRGRSRSDVFVVTHPVSLFAQGGVSVIPFQERKLKITRRQADRVARSRRLGLTANLFSTRQ
ncbi:MAG TPA: hypothetical protein VKT71_05075 [Candidatus Acidoferrales bacterium]|nr:hypothetical protein [Candidatus Acidoferrales bacterium]